MKKIALIYDSLGYPELPYETALRNKLLSVNADDLFFIIYSCNQSDRDVLPDDRLIYSSTRISTIYRWIKFSVKHPIMWIRFIKKHHQNKNIFQMIREWARFAPLIIEKTDIVQLWTVGYYPKFRDFIQDSKVIVSFRGADIVFAPTYKPEYASMLKDDLFQNVDLIHFVSKFLLNESLKWGGKVEKSTVIYIGIDKPNNNHSSDLVENHNAKVKITTIGRLFWKKGYIFALKAMRIVKEKGYSFEYNIIGGGIGFDEIHYWRENLGLENEVNLLGFLSQSEKDSLLNSTDIYLQPSLSEGLCVTVLEAMAKGLPVIASNVGGMTESIINNENGLLVPPADPIALAEALINLIDNKDLRNNMGEKGRLSIINNFSLDQEVDGWIKVYKSL